METSEPAEKRCAKCGEIKPISEFHRNRKSPDGLQYYCRECVSGSNRASRRSAANTSDLAAYTPRQLMQELVARGYKGTLTYTKQIDITKL